MNSKQVLSYMRKGYQLIQDANGCRLVKPGKDTKKVSEFVVRNLVSKGIIFDTAIHTFTHALYCLD